MHSAVGNPGLMRSTQSFGHGRRGYASQGPGGGGGGFPGFSLGGQMQKGEALKNFVRIWFCDATVRLTSTRMSRV